MLASQPGSGQTRSSRRDSKNEGIVRGGSDLPREYGLCAGGLVLSNPHQGGEILRVGLNVPSKPGWEEPLDSLVGWL